MDRTLFIDGKFVSERVSQVVEAIREYDSRIDVEYVPQSERAEGQDAFRLVYRPGDGKPDEIMFHVKTEEEFDIRVLKKIIANDQARGGGTEWSEVEAFDEAAKRITRQAWLDKLEEANDMAASVLRSPLNNYKLPNGVVIKDHGNRTR